MNDGYDAAEVTQMPNGGTIEVVDRLWDWQVVEAEAEEEEASGQEVEAIVANDSSLAPINIIKPTKQKDRNPPWTTVEDQELRNLMASGKTFTEIRDMLSSDSTPFGVRQEAIDRFLEGSWQTLSRHRGGRRVHVELYGLYVYFPADFKLHPCAKKVKVKAQLSPDGTTSAHCVVNTFSCIDEDPARRLEVLISAYSEEGRRITCWGEAGNEILNANTLVDYLHNVDFDTIARTPRRSHGAVGVHRAYRALSS